MVTPERKNKLCQSLILEDSHESVSTEDSADADLSKTKSHDGFSNQSFDGIDQEIE